MSRISGERFPGYPLAARAGLASAGASALLLGTAVYLLDRDWQSAWFLQVLASSAGGHAIAGNVFGTFGDFLPSLAHTFAFCVFTALVVGTGSRARLRICCSWVTIGALFELLQLPGALPDLQIAALARTVGGVFDPWDLWATLAGGLAAWLLLAGTPPTRHSGAMRRSSTTGPAAVVAMLGIGALLGSGPGPEGPVDIRNDATELPVYRYSLGSMPSTPLSLTWTEASGAETYQDVLTFPAPGLTGTYDRTYGFSVDPGSVMDVNTDGATPRLGAFRMTVVEAIGKLDGERLLELDGGVYNIDNGVDSVNVRILPGVPEPAPSAGIPYPTFEVSVNGAVAVELTSEEFGDPARPLAERQAFQAIRSMTDVFDSVMPAVLLAENRVDEAIDTTPRATPCDAYYGGIAPPVGLPARGTVSVTRTTAGEADFSLHFSDCAFVSGLIFQTDARLYRGDMVVLGWIQGVDDRNVLTNFGFASVRFEGARVNELFQSASPAEIQEPTISLGGGFGLDFYPP